MEPGTATIEEADARAREALLMAGVAAGDHDALAALYDAYAPQLYGLGLRLLGDRGQAEDLVQETFVRLWRSAARYDPARAGVRGYTFMIARRVATDFLRRASVRPRLVRGDPPPAAERADDDEADRVARAFAVREALDALSGKHRQVLVLTFDEDLSDAQIARRLGVPVGTVRSRTYYALRALKLALEERGLDG